MIFILNDIGWFINKGNSDISDRIILLLTDFISIFKIKMAYV